MRANNKFLRDSAGNVAAMFAVSVTALVLVIGATTDLSRLTSNKQKLQDGLDAATLYVASLEVSEAGGSNAEQGKLLLSEKLETLELNGLNASFEIEGNQVIGTANAELDLKFGSVLGRESSEVAARTVVIMPGSGLCILTLNETMSGALRLNSGAEIDAGSCEVHTHSVASHATIINSGSTLEATKTCSAGGTLINSSGELNTNDDECAPEPDPYAGAIPEPDSSMCDFNGTNYQDEFVHLDPGVYCGWHQFQGGLKEVTMSPGLYVLKNGGWNVNVGDWQGQGVTFYFADQSKVQFNSNTEVDFSPPTSGPYAGILMAETPGLPVSQLVLNDSQGYDFEGVLHLPSRELTLNSGSNVESQSLSIVADSLIVNNLTLAAGPINGEAASSVYIAE